MAKSPVPTLPKGTSAPYAVQYCIHTAAPSTAEKESGTAARTPAGTMASSASTGYRFIEKPGMVVRRFPMRVGSTPGPTVTTFPRASYPRPEGRFTGSI
jgi:hypothetical protein